MMTLKKIIILGLLNIIVTTTLFAVTPTPKPLPCSKDYAPVCATFENTNSTKTFANMCKLDYQNSISPDYTDYGQYIFKHKGACTPKQTPTPNPSPSELICDSTLVTTFARDINTTSQHQGTLSLQLYAHTNNPSVAVNPFSIQFVDEDGELKTSITEVGVGTWSTSHGRINFSAERNLVKELDTDNDGVSDKNLTSSVKYVINNNCDYPQGLSKPATLTVTFTNLPYLPDESCTFYNGIETYNDIVQIKNNEKMKTIYVLENDSKDFGDFSSISLASLRLLDSDNKIQRRVHIPHKGTWLANTATGEVIFVPENNFSGEASIHYAIHDRCSYSYGNSNNIIYTPKTIAKVTVIAPTPTPTPTPKPCPKTKEPVCGQENLCKVSPSGETICLASIPRNTTYTNMCKLFKAGDVFLYAGACHTPTPTPAPKIIYVEVTPTPKPKPTPTITPTPKASPKPKVVTATEEPKPTTKPTQTVETNTTKKTSNIQSSDGSALGILNIFVLMLLTLIIGRGEINRRD